MKPLIGLAVGVLLLAGGCPNTNTGTDSAVTAKIGISSTTGTPPLPVTVTAVDSTSTNGGTLTYAWDFGGLAAADTVSASYTFTSPGFYAIKLTVTDEKGEVGVAEVDVRVQGSATPVAVIQASTNSGPAPLGVQFDGSGSSAADDTIRDYYWDFGDGSAIDRRIAPAHVFESAGTYTVTLRVTTGGGVTGSTTTTIMAGQSNGSLQFDGSQVATLPTGNDTALASWTFEAWFKSSSTGGEIASVGGGAMVLNVDPADNKIHFLIPGGAQDVTAANLVGAWRHVALTFDATAGAALYLDGVPVGTATGSGTLTASQILLGPGFVGKISAVRFWSIARTAAQISSSYNRRLIGVQAGLVGDWPLNDGVGQALLNEIAVGGVRGSTSAVEASDPAWSTDGPSIN